MLSFLKEIREKLINKKSLEKVLVVIGNESVDLDSAISSITLAYHLNQNPESHIIPQNFRNSSFTFAPIINAVKHQIPLKTEVTYWLKKYDIDPDILIAKDELDLSQISNFILVDHHISSFSSKVVSVLDHRPFDIKFSLSKECFKDIQEVGSCATLIGDTIIKNLKNEEKKQYKQVFKLLYGPIVLDTINFNEAADKVRQLDKDVAEYIEKVLEIQDISTERNKVYDELVFARADISSLNSLQLLSKDLKIISSEDGKVRVAIPGVPVLQYLTMENAKESIQKFSEDENIDVVVLMGMIPVGESIERFVGTIDIKNKKLFEDVIDAMKSMKNPELNLVEKNANFMNGKFFQQFNIKASRKQILPVLKQLIN
jgi:exopolyphosphatase